MTKRIRGKRRQRKGKKYPAGMNKKEIFKLMLIKSCLTLLQPPGLQPNRRLCPCDFPGKNTGEDYHFLLLGILPTQGQNLCLLHWHANSRNTWKAFSASCWLWKHFPCKKLLRCLKVVEKKSGEYSG